MRLSIAWIIAAKDFSIYVRKRSVMYSIILFPLIASVGLPLVVRFAGKAQGGIPAQVLPPLLNSFLFFFIIGAATLPAAIASYSLVGEKVEKSLEPLLATPTTDGEIMLGKSLAAFLPSVGSIYIGAVVFMVLVDWFTYSTLGFLYFPNWMAGVTLLLLAPLAAILSIELDIIVSSRANDVRGAQQFAGLMVIPFAVIYVLGETGIIALTTFNLLIICGILLVADIILFYISTAIFQREEILTKWK